MNDAEFAATQHQMMMAAGIVVRLDLVGYLELLAATEAKSSTTLVPAMWEKLAPRIKELRELANALVPFQALAIASMKRQMEEERTPHIIIPGVNDG